MNRVEATKKFKLEAAMAAWRAKGNFRLADACAVALEAEKVFNKDQKTILNVK